MKKKYIIFSVVIVILIVSIIGLILIPREKKLEIKDDSLACIRIVKGKEQVDILDEEKISEIVNTLNTVSYKREVHPYKEFLMNLYNGYRSSARGQYEIYLFDKKQRVYTQADAIKKISFLGLGQIMVDSIQCIQTTDNQYNFDKYFVE